MTAAAREPASGETIVRLFPLTGVLLLPGTFLPLNVFEPRYRALVEDASGDDALIGMIQPRTPAADNLGPDPAAPERPDLYAVGCLGELTECEPRSDGRWAIVLRGLQRFRLLDEIAERHGYRRAVAGVEEFRHDRDEGSRPLDVVAVLAAADRYRRRHELDFDMDVLAALTPARLVNSLAAALPFPPAEKQALLEAPTLAARRDLLLQLMAMGAEERALRDPYQPPTVH